MKPCAIPRRRSSRTLAILAWTAAFAASVGTPPPVRATGDFDEPAVPTLPYYLDRLPAKTPSQVFVETSPDASKPATSTDFNAALLALAKDAEGNAAGTPEPLLAKVDDLLARARLDPAQPGPLCNLLNDVRDLFAAAPPVPGKDAASYIRWRVTHADWFGVSLDPTKPLPKPPTDPEEAKAQKLLIARTGELEKRAAVKGPLRVHWLYLRAALSYPDGGEEEFRQVVNEYPNHPRTESARFMVARCQLNAARAVDAAADSAKATALRGKSRASFEDYLKRYPAGRFAADAKGWLGGIAFDENNYPGALNFYLEQADTPGHPEVLKSAGFMCERCLSRLSAAADENALRDIAARPRLAMSLIYLIVNTSESDNYNGSLETPEQVSKWRRALLPRLAKEVAAHESAYHDGAAAGWPARYLAILAQAASGTGDQARALALCDMAKAEIDRDDDLAFIRLVALQRARRLPEAIAAGRSFAGHFPNSPLARGAALRLALALQDNHQAGLALVELTRLQDGPAEPHPKGSDDQENEDQVDPTRHLFPTEDDPQIYPLADGNLDASRSVLRHDATGAESDQLSQIIDALLCFAPLSELTPALDAAKEFKDGATAIRWRAVLAQRWLGEEENFAEAKKYVTPAQWSVAAAGLEGLAAAAAAKPTDAETLLRLADGWAAARGKLVFAPLETDETRQGIFAGGADDAGLNRRENGEALGLKDAVLDHALEGHDEMRHAQRWWLRAADASPAGSPTRARALWSALKAMPGIAFASPYQLSRAEETSMGAASRRLYDRLRRDCPESREAREFAVYYNFPTSRQTSGTKETADQGTDATPEPEVDPSTEKQERLPGEPEYRYSDHGAFGKGDPVEGEEQSGADTKSLIDRTLALQGTAFISNPKRMAVEVAALRASFHALAFDRNDTALLNVLDDLSDLLKEDPTKLTPVALKRYVSLRLECQHAEFGGLGSSLPPVPGVGPDAVESADESPPDNGSRYDAQTGLAAKPLGSGKGVDDVVFNHIRAAYKAPGMAPLKDYLDVLALAVIANHRVIVTAAPKPGDLPEQYDKDGQAAYITRDYPKLEKLAEAFLAEHPRSNKREAVRLLYARALYDASRPTLFYQYATWPESGHFTGGNIVSTHRREPFDPRKIGAALNAYDKEFPNGRYAAEIRNLRALLAWHTQDWKIALDLTLAALADQSAPDLQPEAALRLANMFAEGLADETERTRLLGAIKAQPAAVQRLREYLPKCDYPLRTLKGWIEAQL